MADVAMSLLKQQQPSHLLSLGSNESVVESPSAKEDMTTLDSLIKEVATPRTRATLEEYEGQTQVHNWKMPAGVESLQSVFCI